MSFFVRLICKPIAFTLNKFGRGTDLPGRLALKMDKHILDKFQKPPVVIAVTGSSGKTSTSYMIYKVLKDNGLKVAHNSKGSNLNAGITSLYIKESNLFGKNNLDAIVLEVDERYTKFVFDGVKPTHIVLSNITRDQPPRHGNYRKVYNTIKSAIPKDATLIINGDDPIVTSLSEEFDNKKIFFGCCKTSDSFDSLESNCLDMVYCEKCHHKLKYNYVQYGCVGNYYCSNCDFKRKDISYEITSVNDKGIIINNEYSVDTSYKMTYFYYNILAAFATANILNIEGKNIIKSLNNIEVINKRIDSIEFEGRHCEILNGKNENAVSYNQAINYVRNKEELKTIVFGFRYISRRYKYQDISWLYDIDFEFLSNVDKFICLGDWANDIAARIIVAGFDESKIIINKDFTNLKQQVESTNGNIYAILDMGTEVPFMQELKENSK